MIGFRIFLSRHMPVSEKRDQGSVGQQAVAHLASIPKRLIRQIGEIERFPVGKEKSAVIASRWASFSWTKAVTTSTKSC